MFSPPLSSAHAASGNNLNGPGSSNAASTSNGYASASNSSPPVQISSPAQMMLAGGMLSPPPILSPLAMVPPHLPFYPYSPASAHPHPHLHASQATPSPHQSNLSPMLYPPTMSGGSAGESSSVAGSSSAGSRSPDLAGSSSTTPPFVSVHRGRQGKVEEGGDGWIVNGGDEFNAEYHAEEDTYDDDHEEGEEEESGFSEVLADAILKRPGSIRALSRRKRERENVQLVEFTFPSISDFGNVRRGNGVPIEMGKAEGGDPFVMEDDGIRAMAIASSEDTPKGGRPQAMMEPLPLGADDAVEESTG